MGNYGYLHLGRVLSYDATRDAYSLESVGLARTAKWPATPSLVPGLQPGDRVILGAKGSSRDDLVILGKVGAGFPEVADIEGLVTALAAKADADDVADSVGSLTERLDAAEGRLDGLDSTLTTIDSALDALGGRLDAAEASLTAHHNRIYALELNPFRADRDLYGDALSTMNREDVTNPIPLVNGTLYVTRLYGRAALGVTALRLATAVAGSGGTCAIGLYAGTTVNAMTQVRSGTIGLTALGRVTHTLSGAYTSTDGTQFAVAILPSGYTTAPQMGGRTGIVHSTMVNPTGTLFTSVSKAGQVSLPASVDFTDGSWTATITSKMWVALA